MWARLKRIFRSFIGHFISLAEDPEKILQQNMRDMRDKVPEMNTGIAKARAGLIRLENEQKQYEQDVSRLTARVKASLLGGDESMAAQFAIQLKQVQEALERNKGQHEQAKMGYDALLKLKEKFMREMKMKMEEATRAIDEARAAEWKGELADVFESFEVAGVDSTHQEMVEKLKDKTALADGKIAAAVESIDMKSMEIEQKAQELEGHELLKQFKLDLGIQPKIDAQPDSEPKKTMGQSTKVQ